MTLHTFTDQQLLAYLDEAIHGETAAEIEKALRQDQSLRERLVAVAASRESGVHGLGDIWRKHRISCPSRDQLGSYLLGAMDQASMDYIQFHLNTVQCRLCQANLDDLQRRSQENKTATDSRRRKYFQTSAGYLHPKSQS